jgi:type IV secretory pathway VirB9-like protein
MARSGVAMRRALFAAVVALAPAHAFALAAPTPGARDSRVRMVAYDPMQVIALASTGLAPLQIILDTDEHAITIAGPLVRPVECSPQGQSGDGKAAAAAPATDWMATSCGSVLVLAPMHVMQPSVMFLRTVRGDGTERTYQFELHTRDGSLIGGGDSGAYMSVRFQYPAAAVPLSAGQRAAQAEAAHGRTVRAEEQAVNNELATAAITGPRNKDYWKRGNGCPGLAPLYAYDDGTSTTLGFAPRSVLPAFSTLGADGKEQKLNLTPEQTTTGTNVLLPGVYAEIRLRAETQVCAIMPHNPNVGADPIGRLPGDGSGTISPNVRRELRVSR